MPCPATTSTPTIDVRGHSVCVHLSGRGLARKRDSVSRQRHRLIGAIVPIRRKAVSSVSKDDREIYRNIVQIARAMDERAWTTIETLVIPEATGDVGNGQWNSAAEILVLLRSFPDECGPTQHLIGNVRDSTSRTRSADGSDAPSFWNRNAGNGFRNISRSRVTGYIRVCRGDLCHCSVTNP